MGLRDTGAGAGGLYGAEVEAEVEVEEVEEADVEQAEVELWRRWWKWRWRRWYLVVVCKCFRYDIYCKFHTRWRGSEKFRRKC